MLESPCQIQFATRNQFQVSLFFPLIRIKCWGWCTCGLCVETRRSSTRTPHGDYSTSPPPARNRSSESGFAQNILGPGGNALHVSSWLGAASWEQETRGQLSGTLWSSIANREANAVTFPFASTCSVKFLAMTDSHASGSHQGALKTGVHFLLLLHQFSDSLSWRGKCASQGSKILSLRPWTSRQSIHLAPPGISSRCCCLSCWCLSGQITALWHTCLYNNFLI